MQQLLKLLHSDKALSISGVVVGLAIALKYIVPEHTMAHKLAQVVIEAGAALGISSTTSRAAKESSGE